MPEGYLEQVNKALEAQEALAKRERYLAALVEVHRRLLAYRDRENYYKEILEPLGEASGASRIYIFENHRDASGELLMSQRAEWCELGISPEIDNPILQNLSYNEFFPRWAQALAQGEIIAGIVREFPELERFILESQGILSILILPLIVNGAFFGFIGFDNCKDARAWEAAEVDLLKAAAAAISQAQERKQAQEDLMARSRQAQLGADVGAALTERNTLSGMLHHCVESVVKHLDAALARIWLLNPTENMLELQASAGMYTRLDGSYARIPVGNYKVGLIAQQRQPYLTNKVLGDQCLDNKAWALQEGMIAFAGYPLIVEERLVGVITMFARLPLTENTISALASIADEIALGIERKRAEEALRKSEELYRTLVSNFPNGAVLLFDHNLRYTLGEGLGLAEIGLSKEKLPGKTIWEVFPPEMCNILEPSYRAALGGATTVMEVPYDNHFYMMHVLPVKNEQEEVLAGMVMTQNITEQKQAEAALQKAKDDLKIEVQNRTLQLCDTIDQLWHEIAERQRVENALRESEERFRLLAENSTDMISRHTPDGIYLYVSPACYTLLGYKPEELVGRSAYEFLHPDDVVALTQNQQNILDDSDIYTITFRARHRHGHYVWFESTARSLRDARTGAINEIHVASRDITERKRAEADIQRALEKEKQLNELKSNFVSMTSHEFRTPLTIILSSAQLIENYGHKWTEEKKRTYLQRIQVGGKRITQLLDDILVVGKADAGKLQLEPAPLNLVEFCHSLVEEMQLGDRAQHTIEFISQADYPDACMDEKLLQRILSNLLSNALKYSPSGSTVNFELTHENSMAVFKVQDRGIGIPEADQKHLFDSFQRASNVGTIPGTGLGLAIVKKCVDLQGGAIAVSSEVGVGTLIAVMLPLVQEKSNE